MRDLDCVGEPGHDRKVLPHTMSEAPLTLRQVNTEENKGWLLIICLGGFGTYLTQLTVMASAMLAVQRWRRAKRRPRWRTWSRL